MNFYRIRDDQQSVNTNHFYDTPEPKPRLDWLLLLALTLDLGLWVGLLAWWIWR